MPAEIDILAAENRRLLREVKELRARVNALESSRWWRAHPRFLLKRVRGDKPQRGRPRESRGSAPIPPGRPDDRLTAQFREEVLSVGSFRSDMASVNFQTWEPFLEQLEARQARILEIGSFEGMSACYFLWRLADARVTCIDTFAGGPSFEAGTDVSGLEGVFDRNIALVDAGRVRKLVGDSAHHLLELVRDEEKFDLIFVDGSHLALDVLVDGALAWQVLAGDGFMIFDDYLWRSPLGEDPLFQPASAIDALLTLVGAHCAVLAKEKQVILQRHAVSNPSATTGAQRAPVRV